jgi:hypothetical protein
MQITLTHHEEVTKLLEQHQELVWKMHTEMEAIAEPFVPLTQLMEASAGDDEEEEDEEPAKQEPSILNVLNED